jgi:hypothetical protein
LDAAPIATSLVFAVICLSMRSFDERPFAGIEGNHAKRDAALFRDRLPRSDVALVVELRHHDLVARAPPSPQRARHVEGDGRHVVAEGDFARRRVEEIGEGLPRAAIAASVSMLVG